MTVRITLLALCTAMSAAVCADEPRPNLLVLLTDDQKVDSLGCYKEEQPL